MRLSLRGSTQQLFLPRKMTRLRFPEDTMEKLFALATVMVIVAFAVVYTIAALNGPSKAK